MLNGCLPKSTTSTTITNITAPSSWKTSMGCITSTKKITELRQDNVFHVRVVHVIPGSPTILNGYLELTPRELIFHAHGRDPVKWALQHLRRYGLNGDIFSFEAGRRCMTGPGIYTFRCQQAEPLFYPLFQRYINAINTDAFGTATERERLNSVQTTFIAGGGNSTAVTSSGIGSSNIINELNLHSNNYLEPAPITVNNNNNSINNNHGMLRRPSYHDTHHSILGSPLTNELDSPNSLPSLAFNHEVVPYHSQNHSQAQSPTTPSAYINANVYFEQPMRILREHNSNRAMSGTSSAFSTMTRRPLFRGCSLDVPPRESAPILGAQHTDSMHMYANIDTPGACSLRERSLFDVQERCYENVSRLDLPFLLQQKKPQRELSRQSMCSTVAQQQPATPTSILDAASAAAAATSSSVNYIVLDLDQPRSPTQCSPKTQTGFDSAALVLDSESQTTIAAGMTTTTTAADVSSNELKAPTLTVSCTPTITTTTTAVAVVMPAATIPTQEQHQQQQQQFVERKTESSLGYSTIDFIKTWALIKSTTHGGEFDGTRARDSEELRLTRHSKCVRKSYSVSE